MSRQTKYPPIFSLCLAIVRHSDGKILVSSLSEQKPNSKEFVEFPNNLYSDVLSIPLEASLEDRPSEEMRKAVAAKKLSELSPSMPFSSNSESIIDLGLYESPNWGVCIHYLKYYLLAIVEDEALTSLDGFTWRTASEVMEDYASHRLRLSPPTLGLLRCLVSDLPLKAVSPMINGGSHSYRFWHAMAKEIATELPGSLVRFEYAPRLECIPIRSNTLPPFHATNLVAMFDDGDLLIVDPGSNEAGRPHLEAVLQRISPQRLHVFLTHHHHDHIQSLDVVERLFPEAVVIGHPYTLKKLKDCKLKQIPVCGGEIDEVYRIGSREVMCISLPGHTRGHLALWEEASRTLISGDHTVGFGSSVLDPDGGGDMVAYLASTQRLLKLNAQIILPCHGFPTLTDPNELLQTYINHRIEREKEILQAWNSGSHNVDNIITKVYADTPSKLHVAAKRNVWLHLDKLHREGVLELPPEILAEIQKHHDPEADL